MLLKLVDLIILTHFLHKCIQKCIQNFFQKNVIFHILFLLSKNFFFFFLFLKLKSENDVFFSYIFVYIFVYNCAYKLVDLIIFIFYLYQ